MEQTDTMRTLEIPSFYRKSIGNLSIRLHSPFPFYLNDDRKNLGMVVVISVFVTAFLYIFKTPAEANFPGGLEWLHGSITFFCLAVNILLLPKVFPSWMDPISWTYSKYFLLNIWHLVFIGIICFLVDKLFICKDQSALVVLEHVSTQVVVKGIIPIALTTLFLKAHLLQQNLQEAIKSNQELGKIQALKRESPKVGNLITLFSDTSESLTFNLPDLYYVEADDNYSTVVWKENAGIQKRLLRVNLKNLETQLNNSFTLRCHRSYIVNINAITAISGNTNGYKLKIQGADFSIPVSRPKGKEVMEKISQLRNVMELS